MAVFRNSEDMAASETGAKYEVNRDIMLQCRNRC